MTGYPWGLAFLQVFGSVCLWVALFMSFKPKTYDEMEGKWTWRTRTEMFLAGWGISLECFVSVMSLRG